MKSPLVRNGLAAMAGYVVMFAVAFVLFSLLWVLLGPERSFEPGSWNVTSSWIAVSTVFGLIVSVAGGFSCEKLSADRNGVLVLVGLVIIVGILSAMPDAASVAPRPLDVSMFDAMSSARPPVWLLWLNPLIGVAGVVLGARLGRHPVKRTPSPDETAKRGAAHPSLSLETVRGPNTPEVE